MLGCCGLLFAPSATCWGWLLVLWKSSQNRALCPPRAHDSVSMGVCASVFCVCACVCMLTSDVQIREHLAGRDCDLRYTNERNCA